MLKIKINIQPFPKFFIKRVKYFYIHIKMVELNSPDEINSFANQIKSQVYDQDLPFLNISVKYVASPLMFILKGFLPRFDQTDAMLPYGAILIMEQNLQPIILEDYINKLSDDEFEFWYGEPLLDLKHHQNWYYAKIEHHKSQSLITANSLPLLLYAPEQVYHHSKRPRTDMLMFRPPDLISKTNSRHKLPVTRYAAGMSRGLYYSQEPEDIYCGTFYYLEPESNVFLNYHSSLTFKNKYEAMVKLEIPFDSSYLDLIPKRYFEGKLVLPSDLKLTPLEAFSLFPDLFPNYTLNRVQSLPQNSKYIGQFIGLYGVEDDFDQLICHKANDLGIDIIIFTDMIGSHQKVSEILDTRPRVESFNHLTYSSI